VPRRVGEAAIVDHHAGQLVTEREGGGEMNRIERPKGRGLGSRRGGEHEVAGTNQVHVRQQFARVPLLSRQGSAPRR
jgi:hypothetical protein